MRGPQHWLAMTCRNLPGGYVCKNVVPGQIRRWFRIRRKRPCTCKSTAVFSMSLRQTPLQPQARICLLHVIARSKATRQSVSPQKCLTNRCCMGKFVVGSVFAQSIAFRFVLPQGERIATPVCALARNDMQKHATWVRMQRRGVQWHTEGGGVGAVARGWCTASGQGRFSGSIPAVPWYYVDRQQITACHCEERSDGTIRSPAVAHSEREYFGRIRKSSGFA